jgi:hypothetical protein
LLARFREHCGTEFTARMQRMLTDVTVSESFTALFTAAHPALRPPLKVMVVKAAAWPLTASAVAEPLPSVLEPGLTAFQAHYLCEHANRKLTWLHSLATVDVTATLAPGRRYELTVPPSLLALLLPFNTQSVCTAGELHDAAGLPDSAFARALYTLVHAQLLVASTGARGPLFGPEIICW